MINSIYIHIPFCIKKCDYCDFYSIPIDSRIIKPYIESVCQELIIVSQFTKELKTIYLGGGTPTTLSSENITQILDTIKENYTIHHNAEITIEANPCSVSEEKIENLLSSGINRISFGIQSFIQKELKLLGRSHQISHSITDMKLAKKIGFKNISLDLMYGLPGQTITSFEYSLKKSLEFEPEHISVYELTPARMTPLYKKILDKDLIIPEEDITLEMFYKSKEFLEGLHYVHYEISNYSKPNYECLHNLNYWNCGEYIGIGVGAHSFLNRKRIANTQNIQDYIEKIKNNISPITEEIFITDEEQFKELIILGLRKIQGINIALLPSQIINLTNEWLESKFLKPFVEIKNNHLMLTDKGIPVCNEIILKILSNNNTVLP